MPDLPDALFPGELDETHWAPPKHADWMDLERAVGVLDQFENGLQYLIGDALIFAEERFGEEWTQLIPEGKADTWRGYKWVAERIAPQIRRQLSGFSQAKLIAKYSPEEQAEICDKHEPATLSKRELAEKIQAPKEKPARKGWPEPTLTWGQLRDLISEHEAIDDDTPICLNIGPAAVDITVCEQPDDNYESKFIEGAGKDQASALCDFK